MLFKKKSPEKIEHQQEPVPNFLGSENKVQEAKPELSMLIEQILQSGVMSIDEQLRIYQLCDSDTSLSMEDYLALELLRKSLASGKIQPPQQKHVYNAMEQLVKDEILKQLVELNLNNNVVSDVGDILAYALNRLPSCYATSEEGLNYQRQQAKERLDGLIKQQVSIAINTIVGKRDPFSQRTPLSEDVCKRYKHLPTVPWDNNLLDDPTDL